MKPQPHIVYHPPLMHRFEAVCTKRRLSAQTRTIYRGWIIRYLHFHDARHPSLLTGDDLDEYLDDLVAVRHVSAVTRRQARCAVQFFYRHVLETEIAPTSRKVGQR